MFTLASFLLLHSDFECVYLALCPSWRFAQALVWLWSKQRSQAGQRCCCEAVGGCLGQLDDFGWVERLDVVHSSSHPKRFGCVPSELSLEDKYCLGTVLQNTDMSGGNRAKRHVV